MVILYTQPGCFPCKMTARRLGERGVEFDVRDVSSDETAMRQVRDLGYQQTPVVVAGDRHWSGYIPSEIDSLVAA